MSITACKHDSCTNGARASGFCSTHYMRWWRGQDMDRVTSRQPRPAIVEGDIAKIPLGIGAKDGYAIVDKEFAWLDKYKWHMSKRNAVTRDKGDKLHHMITGKPKDGLVVDHINRDTKDNRRVNLRFATNQENTRNISMQKNNTSGYKGVHRHYGKWQVEIKVDYKKIRLGRFTDIRDAARCYNEAALKYFGEFASLNDV